MIRKCNSMKKIQKPTNNISTILDNCTAHMNEPRKSIIEQVKPTVISETDNYDILAETGLLFTIPEHDNVDSIAQKNDMEALYTQKFVPATEANRDYYDQLILLAPNGKCPYCQQNIVKHLDHFLPKSKYVTFTVTQYNLVPSCSDCNSEKSDSTFTSYVEQPFHPYYDDFDDTIWLKANLIENEPISFQFYADPPNSLASDKRQRIINSFASLKLNDIYKVHAPELYSTCSHRIKKLFDKGGKELAIERLKENIEDEQSHNNNSWKAAMYQAMIDSDWYWDIYLPSLPS